MLKAEIPAWWMLFGPCRLWVLVATGTMSKGLTIFRRSDMKALVVLMLVAATASGALAAGEPPPAKPAANENTCLFARQISSWSQLDDNTVVLRSGSRKFKVTFVGPCRQAKWAYAAHVDHFSLCVRPGDVMIFSSTDEYPISSHWPHWGARRPVNGFEQRCMIDSVSLLPPDWKPPPPASRPG